MLSPIYVQWDFVSSLQNIRYLREFPFALLLNSTLDSLSNYLLNKSPLSDSPCDCGHHRLKYTKKKEEEVEAVFYHCCCYLLMSRLNMTIIQRRHTAKESFHSTKIESYSRKKLFVSITIHFELRFVFVFQWHTTLLLCFLIFNQKFITKSESFIRKIQQYSASVLKLFALGFYFVRGVNGQKISARYEIIEIYLVSVIVCQLFRSLSLSPFSLCIVVVRFLYFPFIFTLFTQSKSYLLTFRFKIARKISIWRYFSQAKAERVAPHRTTIATVWRK